MPTETIYAAFLRDLPRDWQTAPLSAVAKVVGGGTPSRDVPGFWGGDVAWITPGEVSSERSAYLCETRERISIVGLAASGATLLPPGSLMVTTRATLGARAINSVPMTTNQGFKSLVFANEADAPFFYYLTDKFKPELKRRASGTTFLEVSGAEFGRIEVPMPPVRERQLISEILDTLDTTIRQTEAVIEKLKQVKQGLLHDLLTRGIDANGELRPPQSQAPHLYKDSSLGWVPRDWEVLALANVSMSVGDGVHHAVERSSAGVPFLFVSCVRNGTIDWSSASFVTQTTYSDLSKRCRPKKGMILFTAVGSYGHAAHVDDDRDFGFERNIAFILPNSRLVQSRFLFHFLSSTATRAQVERLVIGNAQKVLTLTALNSLLTVRPPTEEQSLISAVLDAASNLVAGETKVVEKLRLQKSGLMDDLLTGRVRVTPLLNATP